MNFCNEVGSPVLRTNCIKRDSFKFVVSASFVRRFFIKHFRIEILDRHCNDCGVLHVQDSHSSKSFVTLFHGGGFRFEGIGFNLRPEFTVSKINN